MSVIYGVKPGVETVGADNMPEPPDVRVKTQREARRWVLNMMRAMLLHELTDPDGWMFGGVTDARDIERLRKAIKLECGALKRRVG